jgi:hypothetical protein
MVKVVALQSSEAKLAGLLRDRGYQVIDLHQSSKCRTHVDALLYTSHHPETVLSCYNSAEVADITLGDCNITPDHFPSTIMFNISGLNAEQAAEALDRRFRHRHWNH